MKRFVYFSLLAAISTVAVWAEPVWEGDWSKIRRYGHGQDRDMFSAAQLAYIDENIAYLTLEKIHGADVFSGGNLDQSTIATADLLQNTKVLLYLQAFYAWQRYTAIYDMDRASYPDLFVPDGGMDPFAYNMGTAAGREFWASISDDVVNDSNVVGTYVDAIGKIDTHGHSEWIPEFKKTLSQLDGLTIMNGHPGGLIDHCDGFMREDIVKETPGEIRDNLNAYMVISNDKHMFFNSFNADYRYALSAFLVVAHEKSFFRYFPLAPDLSNNSARWADVLWHCEEYHKPLGPPKGKGVRVSDWIYERSFEYADVWLDLENTNSIITWHQAPVAHWTMEDGSGTAVSDVSGNGYDGTLSGGAWVTGQRGGALEFNGSTSADSVNIPADIFVAVTNEITVSMWVKGDATEQPRDDSVFQALDASGNPLFNIQLPAAGSQVIWDAGDSSGYDRIVKTASTADFEGQWNHWAFTKNATSGTMNMYLNGALWQSGSGNTTPMNGVVANACFGSGEGTDYYEGTLDDVRIYNTVLSASEIAVLAETRPVADSDSISVNEDASVAITLSGSDADGNPGPLAYTVGAQPAYGTLSGTVPNLTYTPDADFFGSDRFYFFVNDGVTNSYAAEVSITVNGVQDMPEALPRSIVVSAGEPLGVTLSGTDVDGENLAYTVVTDPVNGMLSGTAPNLTYIPDPGFLGNDSFTFKVNDGLEDSAPAMVSVFVSENVSNVIAAYDFDDGSGTATTNVTISNPHVTASHFGVGAGLNPIVDSSGNSLAEDLDAENRFFGTDYPLSFGGGRDSLGFIRSANLSTAISSNEYMTITVTPVGGAAMDLSRLTFRAWIESVTEAANSWALYSSADGFAQAIDAGETTVADQWVNYVIDLSDSSFQGLEEAIEFRLYIYGGRNNSGSLTLFDKVILHGQVDVALSDSETVAAIGSLTNAPAMYTSATGSTLAAVRPGEVVPVFIDGEDYLGNPTRFYAYVGLPEEAGSSNQVPAIIIVHGGGGTAYSSYVETWNSYGYAAISIATEGQTDDTATAEDIAAGNNVGNWYKHEAAGPSRNGIYGDSGVSPITDQFMYHAVADAVLANSLLRSLPEVDENRVGIMGASWGGVITSTTIGIDDRLAYAIPIYGCGHLYDQDNHWGRALVDNEVYKTIWDPMVRMQYATLPTLWYSWPSDIHFGLDSQAKTYAASPAVHMVSSIPGLGHNYATFESETAKAYADSIVFEGTPWCVQESVSAAGNRVSVTFQSTKTLDSATLISTTDSGLQSERIWTATPAALVDDGDGRYVTTAALPENTTAWFMNVSYGNAVATSDYQDLENPVSYPHALLAHWPMSDGSGTVVSDVSGNGFDGTLSGGTWVTDRDGGALEFNGSVSSDSVSIPAELFSSVSNEITIAMWVNGDAALQPRNDTVFAAQDASGNRLLNIHVPWSSSKVYWDAGDSSGYDRIEKTASEADFEGEWNHWVFTKDAMAGTMDIYLNGVLWHSGTGNTTMMTGTVARACFGSGVDASYYEGMLDDIRIYNYGLSESAIAALAKKRPIAEEVSVSVNEEESVAIPLSGWSPDGSNLTYSVVSQPLNGSLSGSATNLVYTSDVDYFGSDQFFYMVNDGAENSLIAEVSINVNSVNDAPEAAAQTIIARQGESTVLLLSGTDADGDSLNYEVLSAPAHGSLSGTAPNLSYTPDVGYVGADSFTFKVNDGQVDSAPAPVSISVIQHVTEVIAAYDFDDGTGTATLNVTLSDPNITAGAYGVGSGLNVVMDTGANSLAEDLDAEGNIFGTTNGISFGGNRDTIGFTRNGNLSNALSENEYMTFTVEPADRVEMDLSRLTFRVWIENAVESVNSWSLYSSIDGFGEADAIASGTTTNVGEWVGHIIDLSAAPFQGITDAVEFRLYIYGGRNNSGSTTLFDKVILHGATHQDGYTAWVADFGLTGDDALSEADPENDGLGDGYNNLAEFALGMNPRNADAGSRDWIQLTAAAGTNYFEYIHFRRVDYAAEGLSYLMMDTTNLIGSVFMTNAQDQILVGPAVDGYESVTNRYAADVPAAFIKLEIRKD
ncbi:Ig-like domain-containing protein [Pontiellaceae bacterium B12219]|nr:Ig-like domain-containing protein [Pontiellaceae bacterium B12219]